MALRILIVEDEYWTARHLAMEVGDRGATVVGPVGSLADAVKLLKGEHRPDAVVLDIQLRADEAFSLADLLMEMDLPFVFATGFEKEELPARFGHIPHFVKPFTDGKCVDAALALIERRKVS